MPPEGIRTDAASFPIDFSSQDDRNGREIDSFYPTVFTTDFTTDSDSDPIGRNARFTILKLAGAGEPRPLAAHTTPESQSLANTIRVRFFPPTASPAPEPEFRPQIEALEDGFTLEMYPNKESISNEVVVAIANMHRETFGKTMHWLRCDDDICKGVLTAVTALGNEVKLEQMDAADPSNFECPCCQKTGSMKRYHEPSITTGVFHDRLKGEGTKQSFLCIIRDRKSDIAASGHAYVTSLGRELKLEWGYDDSADPYTHVQAADAQITAVENKFLACINDEILGGEQPPYNLDTTVLAWNNIMAPHNVNLKLAGKKPSEFERTLMLRTIVGLFEQVKKFMDSLDGNGTPSLSSETLVVGDVLPYKTRGDGEQRKTTAFKLFELLGGKPGKNFHPDMYLIGTKLGKGMNQLGILKNSFLK